MPGRRRLILNPTLHLGGAVAELSRRGIGRERVELTDLRAVRYLLWAASGRGTTATAGRRPRARASPRGHPHSPRPRHPATYGSMRASTWRRRRSHRTRVVWMLELRPGSRPLRAARYRGRRRRPRALSSGRGHPVGRGRRSAAGAAVHAHTAPRARDRPDVRPSADRLAAARDGRSCGVSARSTIGERRRGDARRGGVRSSPGAASSRRHGSVVLRGLFEPTFLAAVRAYYHAIEREGYLLGGDARRRGAPLLYDEPFTDFLNGLLAPIVARLTGERASRDVFLPAGLRSRSNPSPPSRSAVVPLEYRPRGGG